MEVEQARFATQNIVKNEIMKTSKYLSRALAATVLGCLGVSAAKAGLTANYQISSSTADLEIFGLNYNTGIGNSWSSESGYTGGIQISQVGTPVSGLPTTYTTVCTDVGGIVWMGDNYTYDAKSFLGQAGLDPSWGYNAYGQNGSINGNTLAGRCKTG
jgi:hypothetical protein